MNGQRGNGYGGDQGGTGIDTAETRQLLNFNLKFLILKLTLSGATETL